MQNIKKYFMTLALLLTAVTGAWAADTYTITFKANNKTKTIENVTLPHTFMSVNNQGNGELDLIVNDLYNQSEGWCVEIPTVSGNSNVTAGLDGSYNQYITISAPFEGNATVSAMHFYNNPISSFTYTLEISVESPSIDVKWDAATKSGTFVMPGSDVELQVEYYPESNLFLGKEALKDKANISVLNGETAVAFDDDGKSTATVTEGNTVTAKFTGKKVLGMKVAKKAKSLIVNPIVGQVIGSDGKNYDANATLPDGVKAVAKICYVSGSNGLALALTDEESYMNWSTAQTTCAAHTPAITGGTWKLATKDEWSNMISAAGSNTALRDGFSSVGGTNMKEDYPYWSSTEDGSDNAWYYFFGYGVWGKNNKGLVGYVRACLAF